MRSSLALSGKNAARRRGFAAGVLARACVAAVLAGRAAANDRTPAGFVAGLYAPYLAGRAGGVVHTGENGAAFFDARLLRLMRRDEAAHAGEVGTIDADPICQCQDWTRFTGFSAQLRRVGPGRAVATVHFFSADVPEAVRLVLRRTGAGWRIDDVAGDGYRSLLRLLATGRGWAAARAATPHGGAVGFVRGLYDSYVGTRRPVAGARGIADLFASDLAAAIAGNDAVENRGAAGALAPDPFCECASFATLRLDRVERVGGGVAVHGRRDGARLVIVYRLECTPAGWRITDIVGKGGSLLTRLRSD